MDSENLFKIRDVVTLVLKARMPSIGTMCLYKNYSSHWVGTNQYILCSNFLLVFMHYRENGFLGQSPADFTRIGMVRTHHLPTPWCFPKLRSRLCPCVLLAYILCVCPWFDWFACAIVFLYACLNSVYAGGTVFSYCCTFFLGDGHVPTVLICSLCLILDWVNYFSFRWILKITRYLL